MEMLRLYSVYMRRLVSAVLFSLAPTLAAAQASAPSTKAPSAYDKIWGSFTEVYSDDDNAVVQRVLLSGRFHYDFAHIDADQGETG